MPNLLDYWRLGEVLRFWVHHNRRALTSVTIVATGQPRPRTLA